MGAYAIRRLLACSQAGMPPAVQASTMILGLPLHPLVVHAVVMLVPLAALSGIAIGLLPESVANPFSAATPHIAVDSPPVGPERPPSPSNTRSRGSPGRFSWSHCPACTAHPAPAGRCAQD